MTLVDLTRIANDYADEQYDEEMTKDFANEAIAKININLDIELPYFSSTENYDAINETWQRVLFVPYILYSIKANDGSQNESMMALQKFNEGLKELKRSRSFDIKKIYRMRWYETTEYEYNNAKHKADDYIADAGVYDVGVDALPRFTETYNSEDASIVKYEDSYIKVVFDDEEVDPKYYKLQDNRQAAIFKVGTGWL